MWQRISTCSVVSTTLHTELYPIFPQRVGKLGQRVRVGLRGPGGAPRSKSQRLSASAFIPSLAAPLRTADQAMYAAKGYDTPLAVSEYAPKEVWGSKIKEPRHHPPEPQREDEQSAQVQQETRTQHLQQRHVATPIDDGIRRRGDGQHESTTAR